MTEDKIRRARLTNGRADVIPERIMMESSHEHEPLAPALAALLSSHWGARPFCLSGAFGDAAPSLSLDEVLGALARRPDGHAAAVKAQYFDRDDRHREFVLPSGHPRLVRDLLEAGMTVCVCDFDEVHRPTARRARALAAHFRVPEAFDASCYVSAEGRGFGLHLDDVPVLVLQIAGKKRWLHGAAPAIAAPTRGLVAGDPSAIVDFVRCHRSARLDVPAEHELVERVLAPGDALFLPAGTWHRTTAEELSIGLTFTLSPRRLDARLLERLSRRCGARLTWNPAAPAGAMTWNAERLDRIRDEVARVTADDRSGPFVDAAAQGSPRVATAVGAATTLRRADDASLLAYTARDEAGRPVVVVTGPDEATEMPLEFGPMIEAMRRSPRGFSAADCLGWSTLPEGHWPAVRAVLEALVESGALTVGSSS